MRLDKLLGVLVALGMCWTSGCAHMSNAEKGVGTGGLIGAGTGAIIGNAVGHTGAGALIGAGVGALSGGLVGNAIDNSERKTDARIAAATAPPARGPLGMMDVVNLAQNGVSDPVIISQIRTTGSMFRLSSNDTIFLKQQNVSDPVIQEMLATGMRVPPPRHVYVPAPAYQPVYVIERTPPPPVIGVGFGYSSGGRHCR